MLNAAQWLDWYKERKNLKSDYALAKKWDVPTAYVSQWRSGRMKLPLAVMLEIAASLEIDVLEIITALEYPKASARWQEGIKKAYFKALEHTIGRRMSASRWGWRK